MTRKASYFSPSLAHVFFIIIFIILIIYGNGLLDDADTGYHIRAGEYILDSLSIPRTDLFSYLDPPLPWTAHEWLAEVIMALVHGALGLTGVVIFFSALIAFTFFLFFKLLRLNYNHIILLWLIALFATAGTTIHWLARPHAFSFLFLILWYFILDSYEYNKKNYLYFSPIIMLVWVNLHGGYIIGFVLLGIYFLGNFVAGYSGPVEKRHEAKQKARSLFFAGFACLLASMINPLGYEILFFPFNLVTDTFLMAHVMEFMPTNMQEQHPFKYFFFVTLAVMLLSKWRPTFIEVFLLLLFTYMALYSVRYTTLFAIIIAPIVLRRLEQFCENSTNPIIRFLNQRAENIGAADARAKGLLWPIVILAFVTLLGKTGIVEYDFDSKKKPVAAVEFLLQEPIPGNMFNNDEFGDYLIYAAHPQYKVFFDGRSDMYGVDRVKNYLKVVRLEHKWQEVIAEHNIGWVFYNADSLLSRYLMERPGWHLVYADRVAHIYVRDMPEYQHLIEKFPEVVPFVYEKESP